MGQKTRGIKSVDHRLWDKDKLIRIPKVGETMEINLNNAGITRVFDLKNLPPAEITRLVNTSISCPSLEAAASKAQDSFPGAFVDPVIDHRLHPNPYQSRYPDDFTERIRTSSAMKPFVCITRLISFILDECKRVMHGTIHEDDWYFYHDALSLMTASTTLNWMDSETFNGVSIRKKWLVPQKGLNKGTPYEGRPVGNSPEFMPLDNSLNADIKRAHDLHCIITSKLHIKDPRKFSMRTPKLISRGILRLVESGDGEEGVPCSERVMYDCDKALNSMWEVYKKGGAIVAELANRNGHRYRKEGTGLHGGPRVKGEMDYAKWMQPMVREVKLEQQRGVTPPTNFDLTENSDCDSVCSDDSNTSHGISTDKSV